MNGKISKLLRRHCVTNGFNYRHAKREWVKTPWPERNAVRVRIEQESKSC